MTKYQTIHNLLMHEKSLCKLNTPSAPRADKMSNCLEVLE